MRRMIGWQFMIATMCFGLLTVLMIQQSITEPEPLKGGRRFTVRLEEPE